MRKQTPVQVKSNLRLLSENKKHLLLQWLEALLCLHVRYYLSLTTMQCRSMPQFTPKWPKRILSSYIPKEASEKLQKEIRWIKKHWKATSVCYKMV